MGCLCVQLEDIRLYLMNRSQQNRLSILKVESELCPKVCKRLHKEKRVAVDGWLVGLLIQGLRLRMGRLVLLWTYLKGPVVVGNEISLAFHVAMLFHAFSSTERQLKSTLMTAAELAHTRHAISQWLIQSMVRICGPHYLESNKSYLCTKVWEVNEWDEGCWWGCIFLVERAYHNNMS